LQAALILAVAGAPNLTSVTPLPAALPAELVERSARPFRAPLASAPGSLSAWVIEPRATPIKGTILLLHGVRMDKRSSTLVALSLSDAGYRSVLVDLPGHGGSGGRYLTYGAHEPRDLSRLLDALTASGLKLGPVGAYGFSYGAAVAIDLAAADPRVRSIVAVSPFASLRGVVRDYRRKYLPAALGVIPDAWFQQAVTGAGWLTNFDPDASAPVKNITRSAATLLIHGDADTQVPLQHSQELERAAAGRARLLVLRGATHDAMPRDPSQAIRGAACAWFDEHLSPTTLSPP
jgi:pimeloyl-ACP methyl ester carboxylesterase